MLFWYMAKFHQKGGRTMEITPAEITYEHHHLEKTINLAKDQLAQAKDAIEKNESDLLSLKEEMRDNTTHSVFNLYNSQNFEDMVAMSQYVSPINQKVEDHETITRRITVLEGMIDAPYFARIDFTFDDDGETEQIYIGRASLQDKKTLDLVVYDWRSPIAGLFYRFGIGPAHYEAPVGKITGSLSLKRQYEIHNGVLDYFFDAELQIMDDFLKKLLAQNTSPQMRAIVETIQKEQDIVIRNMENDLLMVQGVAGSGKTSIALHRAAYLMYRGLAGGLSANNIVILSPNTLFEQYISSVLPELGENNVVSLVFEDMITEILSDIPTRLKVQSRNAFLENIMIHKSFSPLLKDCLHFKTSPAFTALLNRFTEELPQHWLAFQDIVFDEEIIAEKAEFQQIVLAGNADIPLSARLIQGENTIISRAKDIMRDGRGTLAEYNALKESLQSFTRPDMSTLYRQLFADSDTFYTLAAGIDLPRNIEAILSFTKENLESETLFYDDAVALAYLQLNFAGAKIHRDIKQVVIDEAQDYYPLHYTILSRLFPQAKYTILGDIHQTLEKHETLSFYETVGNLLQKKRTSLVTMDKSYRCTDEILAYSAKFIKPAVPIQSAGRSREKPQVIVKNDSQVYLNAILAEIKTCRTQGFKSIGLLCKSEKSTAALYESLKDKIDIKHITNNSITDLSGISLIPIYMSKGLEFDAALICDVNAANYHCDDDKMLLYVACTRSLHRLNLFCLGEVSPLL